MKRTDFSAITNWRNPFVLLPWCLFISFGLATWLMFVGGEKSLIVWQTAVLVWVFTALLSLFIGGFAAMNFFKSRSDLKETILLSDPYFGAVVHNSGQWCGSKLFEPLQKKVDFVLEAGADGPTLSQIDFFKQIEKRYSNLCAQFECAWVGDGEPFTDGSSPAAAFQSLELWAIELPSTPISPTRWEMVFTSELDEDHLIRVVFLDWEFQEFGNDG